MWVCPFSPRPTQAQASCSLLFQNCKVFGKGQVHVGSHTVGKSPGSESNCSSFAKRPTPFPVQCPRWDAPEMTSVCVVQAKTRKSGWEPLNPVFWFRAESGSSEKSVDCPRSHSTLVPEPGPAIPGSKLPLRQVPRDLASTLSAAKPSAQEGGWNGQARWLERLPR